MKVPNVPEVWLSLTAGDARESKAEVMMAVIVQFWEWHIILSAYANGHVGQSPDTV